LKLNIAHLRVFGSVAYAKVMPVPAKLELRTLKAVMVSYNRTTGYHLWDPQAHKFLWSRDIVFKEGAGHRSRAPAGGDTEVAGVDENSHALVPAVPNLADPPTPSSDDNPVPDTPILAAPEPEVRHSTRSHAPSKALQDSRESQAEEAAAKAPCEPWARGDSKARKLRAVAALNILTVSTASVPKNYQQAMMSPEVWMPPMQKEYTALIGHKTWTLVDAPPNANIVDCKWVYAVKYDTEGAVVKWKARRGSNKSRVSISSRCMREWSTMNP
jgi:hypothetical protein